MSPNMFKYFALFVLLVHVQKAKQVKSQSTVFSYRDQKQNCSVNVPGSFCYMGPRFDAVGQIKSCSVPGTVAITFDDGPVAGTLPILDALKAYNMKATFFLLGQHIIENKNIVQRIVDEGHQIASHTFSHSHISNMTNDEFVDELMGFENALLQHNYQGVLANRMIPTYFRAPRGFMDTDKMMIAKSMGYTTVHWSMLNGDSYSTDPTIVVPSWKLHFENPATVFPANINIITQQHDTEPATVQSIYEVLEYFNTTLGSRGARFVTVSECMNNVQQPYRQSPRHYEDPLCTTGIMMKTAVYTACCSAACGTCGGTGCGNRIGGSSNCCGTTIYNRNVSCDFSRPPCVVTSY